MLLWASRQSKSCTYVVSVRSEAWHYTITPMHLVWLLFYTTTIEDGEYMICNIIYMVMCLPFGEEFLMLSRHLHLALKLKWVTITVLDFGLIIRWVMTFLLQSSPTYLCSLWTLLRRWRNKHVYLMVDGFGLHNLEHSHFLISQMTTTTSLIFSNRSISLLPRILESGSLSKIVSLASTPFIRHLIGCHEANDCIRWIWTTQASLKCRLHMWLAYRDRLLTLDNLGRICTHMTSPCVLWG